MESLSPNIYVNDLPATIRFYQNLGFNTIASVPDDGTEPVWTMMQHGNVTMMFESFKSIEGRLPEVKRENGGSLMLYIKVADVEAFYEQIKDQVTVLHGLEKTFYGATEFAIKDCNDYVLTFAS